MTMQVDKVRLSQITWQNVMPTEVQSIVTELLELRSLRSTEGKEGEPVASGVVAYWHPLGGAIWHVNNCPSEIDFSNDGWVPLYATPEAAEAHVAKLREALGFYAEPSNYKGAFVQGGYTDHGTFAVSHHVNLVRKDAGALARAALTRSPE